MKTLREYINLLESEVTPELRAVGITPQDLQSSESELPTVDISFDQDYEGNSQKTVQVNAGNTYGGNPDDLRAALTDAGIPIPDQDSEPNDSGINVGVRSDGDIYAIADNEAADELLDILKNAGLYKGTDNA
jgi:hypothetical protein